MKILLALIGLVLISVLAFLILRNGLPAQEPTSPETPETLESAENQAYDAVEQELEEALDNMDMENIESELLE
jgi:hypothetical protein